MVFIFQGLWLTHVEGAFLVSDGRGKERCKEGFRHNRHFLREGGILA